MFGSLALKNTYLITWLSKYFFEEVLDQWLRMLVGLNAKTDLLNRFYMV